MVVRGPPEPAWLLRSKNDDEVKGRDGNRVVVRGSDGAGAARLMDLPPLGWLRRGMRRPFGLHLLYIRTYFRIEPFPSGGLCPSWNEQRLGRPEAGRTLTPRTEPAACWSWTTGPTSGSSFGPRSSPPASAWRWRRTDPRP